MRDGVKRFKATWGTCGKLFSWNFHDEREWGQIKWFTWVSFYALFRWWKLNFIKFLSVKSRNLQNEPFLLIFVVCAYTRSFFFCSRQREAQKIDSKKSLKNSQKHNIIAIYMKTKNVTKANVTKRITPYAINKGRG